MEISLNQKVRKIVLTILICVLGILPILFMLTSCAPLSKEDVINNLFPNLWVFLTHLIAASILIVLMTWLVWKPTRNALQKRHDYIQKQIEEAQQAKAIANMELTEANQLKVDALSQAMTITTQARAEAFDIVEKAKLEAKQASSKILKDAQTDIEKEKREARENAQDNIINIAFDVAGSILNKEVDKQDKDKYIDDLLASISDDLKKSE